MNCPICKAEGSKVIDTHIRPRIVRRRRQCRDEQCKYRWNTIEMDEEELGKTIFKAIDKLKKEKL